MAQLRNLFTILFCVQSVCSAEEPNGRAQDDAVDIVGDVARSFGQGGHRADEALKADIDAAKTMPSQVITMARKGARKTKSVMEVHTDGASEGLYKGAHPISNSDNVLMEVEGDGRVHTNYVRKIQGDAALEMKVEDKKPKNVPKPSEKVSVDPNNGLVRGPWDKMDKHCNELVKLWDPIKFCKDGWQEMQSGNPKSCVAYDIGVRDRADFAVSMIQDYGCAVRAYDPSPVTAQWYDHPEVTDVGSPRPKDDPVFKLHEYEKSGQYKLWKQAAGNTDGDLTLYAYNWQQLSTFRASEETKGEQKKFTVPSKTLQSMMKDNGDDHIDVLKIDIEGSEFDFLTQAFDKMECPPVEHLLIEWHSTEMDMEYGAPPKTKDLEQRMFECGYKRYSNFPFFLADPTSEEKFDIKGTYYGHAGYCKTCIP